MNRSIFPIWKKFSLKNFITNLLFIMLMYLFGFFSGGFVGCDDLIKIVHKGIIVRYSPSISSFRLYNSLEFLQQYVLNTPDSNFNFKIYKYLQLDGLPFSRKHVYNHYHLNLYLDNMFNVHYGFSFTHNPHKLGLSFKEFSDFSKTDFFEQKQKQFILNDLKIYDLNTLKFQDDTYKFKEFLFKHNEKCVFQFKNIFNK